MTLVLNLSVLDNEGKLNRSSGFHSVTEVLGSFSGGVPEAEASLTRSLLAEATCR